MGNLSMAEIPGPSLEFGKKKLEINKRLENVFLKIVSLEIVSVNPYRNTCRGNYHLRESIGT